MKVEFIIFASIFHENDCLNNLNINHIIDFFNCFNCYIKFENGIIIYENRKIIKMNNDIIDKLKFFIEKELKDEKLNRILAKFKKIYCNEEFFIYFRLSYNNDAVLTKNNINYIINYAMINFMKYNNLDINKFKKDVKFMIENYYMQSSEEFNNYGTYTYKKDNEGKECKYCGKKNFKSYSHIIPDNLGGHLIDGEECDECNDNFNDNIEQEFSKYLEVFRTILGIRGKKHVPKVKSTDTTIKFKRKENNDDINKIIILKKDSENITESDNEIVVSLNINFNKVYKCLTKIALGLIPCRDIGNFCETVNWIKSDDNYKNIPKLIEIDHFENIAITQKPSITIFLRKNIDDYSIPYMFVCLNCRFRSYYYIIPFTKYDKNDFSEDAHFNLFFENINKFIQNNYKLIDCNSNKKEIVEQVIVLPNNLDYKDFQNFDEIEKIEGKEIVDFLKKELKNNS